MRISILMEGATERAFLPHLRAFLQTRLAGQMPRLDPLPFDGRIPKGPELRRRVLKLLNGNPASDIVIALTDVYTGTTPPDFEDAADAISKMRQWVPDEPRFFPHAAQFDFEAWLLPFWSRITDLAGSNRAPFAANPEAVNHNKPPAHRLNEIFTKRKYVKPRDAGRILDGQNLADSAAQCASLKAFLSTILTQCGAPPL